MKFLNISILLVALSFSSQAFAKGGDISIGVLGGITTSGQDDVNNVIKQTNAASELGNAWEFGAYFQYRVGDWGLQFRPTMFYQSEEGGTEEHSVIGYNIFPIARWYLLESNAVKFFTNFSIGYGVATGEMKVGSNSVEFSGNSLGYLVGLGAEFCLFGGDHCIQLEGNLRRLNMERTVVDSDSGDIGGRLTQEDAGEELEIDGRDFILDMSGMNASVGYVLYF